MGVVIIREKMGFIIIIMTTMLLHYCLIQFVLFYINWP